MKKLVVIMLMWIVSYPAYANIKVIGNGGDTYATEFVSIAGDIHKYLVDSSSEEINLHELYAIISKTKVESTDQELLLNGIPKDAINYPSKKYIIFNRASWLSSPISEKVRLVLHEYLGVMGLDDSNYSLSTSLLDSFHYGKNVIEVPGPFVVNFAENNEYTLNAYVTLEGTGTYSHIYKADDKIEVVVVLNGERRVFVLPVRGKVIDAFSTDDGIDDGIYVNILQPFDGPVHEEFDGYSTYIPHVVRQYIIQFQSEKKNGIPDKINMSDEIPNGVG